jgi:hypothetical protein
MIPQALQVIGQIGLHIFTTLAKGEDGSLVKIGDVSLVRVENLNLVLALVSPPPQTSDRAAQRDVTADMFPSNEVSQQHDTRAVPDTPHASLGPNVPRGQSSSQESLVPPPFRTGLSVLLDADDRLRPGFRTYLSPSTLFVAESNTSELIAFPSFDYEGVDVKLHVEHSVPTSVHHFHDPTRMINLGDNTLVTNTTRLSLEEITSLVHIEGRFPVVIAPLSGFHGRIWHLRQQNPARDMRHYILVLLYGDANNGA